jgi:hypothetical protein
MKYVVKNYLTIFTLTFYILKLTDLIPRTLKLDPDTILTRTLLKSDLLFVNTDINGFITLNLTDFHSLTIGVLNVQLDNLVTYKKWSNRVPLRYRQKKSLKDKVLDPRH